MPNDAKAKAWEEAQNGPSPGSRWQHYKGGFYTIVGPCVIEATAEAAVAYKSESFGAVAVRSLKNFHEFLVKEQKHRFEKVDRKEEVEQAARKGFYS